MNETQKLQQQIDELRERLDLLTRSATIPREVETAFSERLGGLNATGTGTNSGTDTYVAFPVITPKQATGTLAVVYKGVTYNLLYK